MENFFKSVEDTVEVNILIYLNEIPQFIESCVSLLLSLLVSGLMFMLEKKKSK